MARELKRPGGKIGAVESTIDLGHLLNGHDGRLYPRKVHPLLARVLAPCIEHGDSYHQQEARVGLYNNSGAFVPLNMNTTHVGNARCLLNCGIVLQSLLYKRGHGRLHVDVGDGPVPQMANRRNANQSNLVEFVSL